MAAIDKYGGRDSIDGPVNNADELAEHDVNELTHATRAVYVGGTGDLHVVMLGGQTVVFSAVPAGTVLPIRIKKLLTATTATLIVGMW